MATNIDPWCRRIRAVEKDLVHCQRLPAHEVYEAILALRYHAREAVLRDPDGSESPWMRHVLRCNDAVLRRAMMARVGERLQATGSPFRPQKGEDPTSETPPSTS